MEKVSLIQLFFLFLLFVSEFLVLVVVPHFLAYLAPRVVKVLGKTEKVYYATKMCTAAFVICSFCLLFELYFPEEHWFKNFSRACYTTAIVVVVITSIPVETSSHETFLRYFRKYHTPQ